MAKRHDRFPLAALPVAIGIAFVFSGLVASVVASSFTLWPEPFVGSTCAVSVVLVTFWLAPAAKRTLGLFVLLVGAFMAWLLLPNYYPDGHPKAYQTTFIPLVATVGAGLLSYLCCSAIWPKEKSGKAD
ncbi:MAG: hypothetical protein ABMA26_10135 [Limisphaerales bacterium]